MTFTTPNKVFTKSKKGGGSKSGKSDVLFPKSRKSKSSKGNIHHQNDHLLPMNVNDANDGTPSTNDNGSVVNDTPTSQQTPCNIKTVQDDFNLCIAIDASGSVCGNFAGHCANCKPTAFCQDFGVDTDTCCSNFEKVKEFSSAVVTSLEEFSVEKSFSVVQFGTDATVESELSIADSTLQVFNL